MGIVRFALRFPHTFYVMAIAILFLGISAAITSPKDIFPAINIPVVTVIWQYTGLTPEETDQRLTTYSQYAISSNVNDIKTMESQSLEGVSVIRSTFSPTSTSTSQLARSLQQRTRSARCCRQERSPPSSFNITLRACPSFS